MDLLTDSLPAGNDLTQSYVEIKVTNMVPPKLGVVILLLLWIIPGLAGEEITWIKLDAPPYFILEGPDAGSGIADQIIEIFKIAMPEINHHEKKGIPISRLILMQKEGQKICVPTTLWSKEKEDYLYFSLPVIINPPYALVAKYDKGSLFGSSGYLSLTDLINKPGLKFGVADRAYGDPIDQILLDPAGQRNVVKRMGTNLFTALLEMLDLGRLDFVAGTPYEIAYAKTVYNRDMKLMTFGIAEIEKDSYLLSYAAFPKTPWGLEMRNKVNDILLRVRKTQLYKDLFLRWLDPESAKRLDQVWTQKMETSN